MRRFLFLSIPLLIITMGLFQLGLEMLHLQTGPDGGPPLPGSIRLATWALEALSLSALFLLVHGRGWGWVSGLLTGWIAWVFRGPLLVMAVATHSSLSPGPWWSLAFRWWILYSMCGILLGLVAALTDLNREAREEDEAEAAAAATALETARRPVAWQPPRPEPHPEPPPEPRPEPREDSPAP